MKKIPQKNNFQILRIKGKIKIRIELKKTTIKDYIIKNNNIK